MVLLSNRAGNLDEKDFIISKTVKGRHVCELDARTSSRGGEVKLSRGK